MLCFLFVSVIGCSKPEKSLTENVKDSIDRRFHFDRSYGDFTIKEDFTGGYRLLSFSSNDSIGLFTHIKFTVSSDTIVLLETELSQFGKLWHAAMDSISVHLRSVSIGYPMVYQDVLNKHIDAFRLDSTWRTSKPVTGGIDYARLRSIMLGRNVYEPLDKWLEDKRYKVTALSTEKHGFISKADLTRLGYDGNEEIPLPFMVSFRLEKI